MSNDVTHLMEPKTASGGWLLGSTREFLRDPLGLGTRGFDECGEVVRYVFGLPGMRREYFIISDPEGAAQVLLAPHDRNFRKDSGFYQPMRELYGNGLVTSQDETWRRQRRFIQPLFTARSVDSYTSAMAEEVDDLTTQWRARPDGVLDVGSEMTRLTLSIVARVLFGEDSARLVPIVRSTFPVLGRAARWRGISPAPIPLNWPSPANRRIARAQQHIHAACDEIIAHRRAAAEPGSDLIGRLVAARDGDDTLSDNEIRDQVKIFLFAGHDTTATALTFALRLLGSAPDAQARVREEADRILTGPSPTAADVHALTYTAMVLKETTRLYPSAPYLSRRAVQDADVCGFHIPADADITIAPWVIHHRADLWPDPYRFDPDRFDADHDGQRHKFAWFPFGHGPRGCIGQRFAMLEAALTLAILVREFEFETPPGDIALTTDVVLHPIGEVPCHVRRRTQPKTTVTIDAE
ncbi:cytochrome P450 [Nocardia salmonicida]|uniref:cytochrome P450 n=1 Tax=Nocardia salmonicida TaxID=53431 RepID=UPI00344146D9